MDCVNTNRECIEVECSELISHFDDLAQNPTLEWGVCQG